MKGNCTKKHLQSLDLSVFGRTSAKLGSASWTSQPGFSWIDHVIGVANRMVTRRKMLDRIARKKKRVSVYTTELL